MDYDFDNLPESLVDQANFISKHRSLLKSPGKKGKILRSLLKDIKQQTTDAEEEARQQDPMAFFKPSYEQALILNCWLYGIQFIGVYTANRIGKTVALIVNVIMWIFPNKMKEWSVRGILRPYRVGDDYDKQNQGNPNEGKLVHVLPRPSYQSVSLIHKTIVKLNLKPNPAKQYYEEPNKSILQQLQKVIPAAFAPAFPYAPWNKSGDIWQGAQDHEAHESKIMPIWRRFLPAASQSRYVPSNREITIEVKSGPDLRRLTIWDYKGLSYETKETKWATGAVDVILFTEGVPTSIFPEAKLRFRTPGLGGHDFTPYDPANTNSSVALAKRIKNGQEGMPLPTFVFEKFSVYTAPRHILPEDKLDGLVKSFRNTAEGAARLDGEFYSSSGLVLDNFKKEYHFLPITPEQLFKMFPNARLYRGLDPGFDHPTSCMWGALLPTNQWVFYRNMSQRGLDIPTRCEHIISLSNNMQGEKRITPTHKVLVEIHPLPNSEVFEATVADFHLFKTDEYTNLPYSLNYQINGLSLLESTHMRPRERATLFNGGLKRTAHQIDLMHHVENWLKITNGGSDLQRLQTHPMPLSRTGGSEIYFCQYGPGIVEMTTKWDELYWDRIRSGENKGQPKDEIQSHKDDELDAGCYLFCGGYRWTKHRAKPILQSSQFELQDPANLRKVLDELSKRQQSNPSFSLQSTSEVVVFGGTGPNGRHLYDQEDILEDLERR